MKEQAARSDQLADRGGVEPLDPQLFAGECDVEIAADQQVGDFSTPWRLDPHV
ncbi:MAG: hypothetical protein ACXWX1_01000 [Aeromicrobium sp.]